MRCVSKIITEQKKDVFFVPKIVFSTRKNRKPKLLGPETARFFSSSTEHRSRAKNLVENRVHSPRDFARRKTKVVSFQGRFASVG